MSWRVYIYAIDKHHFDKLRKKMPDYSMVVYQKLKLNSAQILKQIINYYLHIYSWFDFVISEDKICSVMITIYVIFIFERGIDQTLRYTEEYVDSIAKFKTELRKRKDISQVPKHYEIGPQKLNIILTQLRCFAS